MKNPVVQGAIVVGLCLAALCFPTNPQNEIMKWIAVMLVSGLVHFGICRHVVLKKNELGFKTVFLIAVALRLLVLFHDPVLSDDGFRNVWDGRMQIEGMNPYAYAPSSENLAALRDVEVWPRINHKEYRTIYPPTSQLISVVSAFLANYVRGLPAMLAWKFVLFFVEVSGLFLLCWGLSKKGQLAWAIIYAWNPLLCIEFYASGHVDAAGVGLLAGASGLFLINEGLFAGVLFAASVLTKWITLPAVFLFKDIESKRKWMVGSALAAFLICLPYLNSGSVALESLGEYAGNWEFNGVLHGWLHIDSIAAIPGRLTSGESLTLSQAGTPFQKGVGRAIFSALGFGIGLFMWIKKRPGAECALVAASVFLLVQSTIFPWYLMNLLPLLALRPYQPLMLWIALSPLSYEVLIAFNDTGVWEPNIVVQTIAVLPAILWMLGDLWSLYSVRSQRARGEN